MNDLVPDQLLLTPRCQRQFSSTGYENQSFPVLLILKVKKYNFIFRMKCAEGFKYSGGERSRACDWRGKWAPQGQNFIECEGKLISKYFTSGVTCSS